MSGLFSSFPSFWSIRPQTSFRMIAGCSQKRNTLKFVLFSPNFFSVGMNIPVTLDSCLFVSDDAR